MRPSSHQASAAGPSAHDAGPIDRHRVGKQGIVPAEPQQLYEDFLGLEVSLRTARCFLRRSKLLRTILNARGVWPSWLIGSARLCLHPAVQLLSRVIGSC